LIIKNLSIYNLRIIEKVSIEPSPGINLITGQNGSGKTTILEAIYLIARNKSFRTSKINTLINYKSNELLITTRLERDNTGQFTIGIKKTKHNTEVKISGKKQTKLSEVVKQLPLFIITPDVNRIFEDGPSLRRKLLDWGVFHVEHSYRETFQQFNRLLQQRNALLRTKISETTNWDYLLSESGEIIQIQRENYLQEWLKVLMELTRGFNFLENINIELKKGWAKENNYLAELKLKSQKDKFHGFTSIGPHRADIEIKIHDTSVIDILSRGQIKILSSLLILSQALLYKRKVCESPIILIDDIQAELDLVTRKKLFTLLESLDFQIFLTSSGDLKQGRIEHNDWNMFHVEQGVVLPVNI
jgi:DNA replication and repair protein RecF